MALGTSGGLLVVSLDIDGDSSNGRAGAATESATKRLLEVLQRRQVAATFAMTHPGANKLAETVTASDLGHEVAVLGDSSWVGPRAGRTRFARELAWRVRRASDAGLTIRSLALSDGTLDDHLDLLVKHRIGAIREASIAPPHPSRVIRPQLFRYGIWKAAVTCRLPSPGRLWKSADGLVATALKRAATHGEVVHLAIDVAKMAGDEQPTLLSLGRALDRAEMLRTAGRMNVCTLSAAVWELSRVEATRRSQSVLRAA